MPAIFASPDRVTVMGHLLDATAKGVYAISATPFTNAGEIDWASLDSLIDELDLLLARLEARLAQRGNVAHRAVA